MWASGHNRNWKSGDFGEVVIKGEKQLHPEKSL